MNRRHDAPDPLSPEERELAERLLRLGPHDGPSPALDARILVAAHAAVAQTPRARSKTRWPAWIGVAASLTLAIGVAWQLRPMDKALESVGEDQATAASVSSAEADAKAESATAAAAPAAAEASDYARDSSAGAADAAAAIAVPEPPAPPQAQPRMIAPPPPPPPLEAAKRSDAAADSLHTQPRQQEYKRAAKRAETRDVQAFGAPTPIDAPAPAPPAPASAPVYAPAPAAAPAATASDAAKPQLARERRYELQEAAPTGAAATSAPKAEGELRGKSAPAAANAARSVAPAAAQAAPVEAPQPTASNDSSTLERIEVTGSRIMPNAAQEARLTPAQWLELIRGYRDRGDTELARDSLRRFHRAHPQTRVPDDLRTLLK
ncbi:hypothetical protein [Lysobacter sp. Hz 25]|uniref:hypothetical protein n=1 Tax=Lysobacter sp. Hz 25 TaxID=3383698 RepID=UPI0038D3E4FA